LPSVTSVMPAPLSTTSYSIPTPQTGTFSLALCIISAQRHEVLVHNADTSIMATIPVIELSGLGLVRQQLSQPQLPAHEPMGPQSYETQGKASVVCQSQRSPSPCSWQNEAKEHYRKPSYNSRHGSRGKYHREQLQEQNQEGYDQNFMTRLTAHATGDLCQPVNGELPQKMSSG
jgi:hypothetical protein